MVDLLKNHDKWRYDKIVNREDGYKEVPGLAKVPLGVDEVPLDLLLVVDDLVVIIFVILNVVDHHFSKVLLRHLLQSGLESQLVIVTSGFGPQVVDSLLTKVLVVLDVVPGGVVHSVSL